jgi:thiamine-phosphate pyrophosphorylase
MTATRIGPARGLYLLTPDLSDTGALVARVAPLLGLGVAMLQLRNKRADPALRREQALALLPLCRSHAVPLIINDDWRLAGEIGADGAHLGEHDGDLREARAALGSKAMIGASCYNDLARAERAATAGASYLAFGAFYPSGSKPLARRAPLSILQEAARFGLPTVAIGGITPDNVGQVIAAGANFVAVIGAVFDADESATMVRTLQSFFP